MNVMEAAKQSIERSSLKIGLITGAGLIAYFLIMDFLGLAKIIELRYFNFLILGAGIIYGLRNLKRELKKEDFYLKGLAEGFLITLIALIPFALFFSLYLEYVNPELLDYIKSNVAMGDYVNLFSILIVISLEGISSGAIVTFAAMQYFKSEVFKSEGIKSPEKELS